MPVRSPYRSSDGGAGGGGGPNSRFRSIQSHIHFGFQPARSERSSFTIKTESVLPIAPFKAYKKSFAGRAVQTIQQLKE
jgi:hypothetical protein